MPEPSIQRSIALAKSPLPSDRNTILSPPDAFFQASITNTSLTPVTAMVLTPLALIAAAFFTKPGRWFLWQGGGDAPRPPPKTPLFFFFRQLLRWSWVAALRRSSP